MKATLYSKSGEKKGTVELPAFFSREVREDLVRKLVNAQRINEKMVHSTAPEAGKRHSASGTISHQRHKWKGHYGKGISRVPRKTMWRRGTQFYWVGAEVTGTRGGRRPHPPKILRRIRKINEKEMKVAMEICLAATAHENFIKQRYSGVSKVENVPAVVEAVPEKTKELRAMISKIFDGMEQVFEKRKAVRAGAGKLRGRKYKENAGVLIITGKDETKGTC